jgi:hypothetical protein
MYQEAAMLEEHVLKVSIKANGAMHPATLGAQSNLAETSVIIPKFKFKIIPKF